jgi:hypothetical protein
LQHFLLKPFHIFQTSATRRSHHFEQWSTSHTRPANSNANFSFSTVDSAIWTFPTDSNRDTVNSYRSDYRIKKDPPMNTDPNRLERRGAQRFEVQLPLAVHFDGRTVPGFTQDLSGRGIFFYAEATFNEGASVELTFTMPSEITLGESMPVRCCGRVVRAAATIAGQKSGIAVQLDAYEYLPSNQPASQFVRVSGPRPLEARSGPFTR